MLHGPEGTTVHLEVVVGGNEGEPVQMEFIRQRLDLSPPTESSAEPVIDQGIDSIVDPWEDFFVHEREKVQKAIHYYQKAADWGIAQAQFKLGNCYAMLARDGTEKQEIEMNIGEALKWYQKAADAGDLFGTYCIGKYYSFGDAQDLAKAKYLLSRPLHYTFRGTTVEAGIDNGIKSLLANIENALKNSAHFEPSTIKIKGIYIGMDINDIPTLLDKKLAGTDFAEDLFKEVNENGVIHVIINPKNSISHTKFGSHIDMKGFGLINATTKNQVTSYYLKGPLVDILFNSSDLSTDDFVKAFTDAYKIPEMKGEGCYIYTSPDGVKISIDRDKSITVEKVPSETERKASFD